VNAQQNGAWITDARQSGPWTVTAEQGPDPWSVSIAGTPTVALAAGATVWTQAVGGSTAVTLLGTPSVNLAGTAQVNIGNTPNVKVTNDVNSPAIVRSADEHGRQPFQKTVTLGMQAGFPNASTTVTLPYVGTRLIVESISAQAYVPTGQFVYLELDGTTPQGSVQHYFPLTKAGPISSTTDFAMVSQQTLLFNDSQNDLRIQAFRPGADSSGIVTMTIGLSGYFIDLQ
jgi:hypothetical protein